MDDTTTAIEQAQKQQQQQLLPGQCNGHHEESAVHQANSNTDCVQTLYIVVFRGHPRDTESTRIVDFCIIADAAAQNNGDRTYRLEGDIGSYGLKVVTGLGPPRSRPHFVRQFHVATVLAGSLGHDDDDDGDYNNKLHDLVAGTAINNDNPEWTRWTWIDNVLGALSAAGLISSEEGTEVLDATIDCVSSAPYPE